MNLEEAKATLDKANEAYDSLYKEMLGLDPKDVANWNTRLPDELQKLFWKSLDAGLEYARIFAEEQKAK